MLLKLAAVLLLAQVALAQLPSGVSEQQLYQAVFPLDQYAQGYGNSGSSGNGKVERIDNQPVELPQQEENRQGQDQTMDHQLQDEQRQMRVDNTKEIHNYQIQKKIVNINNRILHRYLKNLLVNTIYNTNIQKVNHQKLMNLLINSIQETHQPKLLVKYARQDTTNDLGERNEQPEVSEDRQDKVLPAQFIPATVEKIGYDGLNLPGVSAGGSSSGSGGFSTGSSGSGGFSGGSSGSGGFSGSSSGSSGSSNGGFSSGSSGSGGFSGSSSGSSNGGFSSGGSGSSGSSSGRNFGSYNGGSSSGSSSGRYNSGGF